MSINYNEIKKYISASRLRNYEVVCNNDTRCTLKLYQTNLRLSQAFYPILSLFEVILRNVIDEELTAFFTDANWLINQQTGFMIDSSLSYTDSRTGRVKKNHFLKNSVAKSISNLGAPITHGKIIADLKFGFWTALFDATHYKILAGRPIRIFTKLPSGANRKMVYQHLCHIREFRNRIYHNEPIIFGKNTAEAVAFDLSQARQIYSEIQDLFVWLDLDFEIWTKRINNIIFELARAEGMMRHYPNISYYFIRIFLGLRHYRKKYLN